MKRLLAMAVLLSVSGLASGQSCGQLVETDLRLDRDLHCPGGTALLLARSGITIDLNGHTISGDSGSTGINATALRDVTIAGPGRITLVGTAIEATRVRGLVVRGVDFEDVGDGVRLHNSSHAEVAHNRFDGVAGHAVAVLSLPYALTRGNGHAIHDNVVRNSEFGVLLSGFDAGDSVVENNRFDGIGTFAILDDGAYNRVDDNEFGYVRVSDIAR
jgi:hypothetical protein